MASGLPPRSDGPTRYGWKDIADYFGVTVRTAQLWAAEKGLPVRRMPGERGRLYAIEAELRAWRDHPESFAAPPPPASQPAPATLPPVRNRRRWFWLVLAAFALLAAYPAWRALRPIDPVMARVENGVLVALDRSGHPIWGYAVGTPPVPGSHDSGQSSGIQVLDLDGDGQTEILFLRREDVAPYASDELLCFSARGRLLWSWTAGARLRTAAGKSLGGRFVVFQLLPWATPRTRGVVVVASDTYEYPCQVVLLDASGRALRTYWHAGHLNFSAIADMDSDGRPELWLGGVSNANQAATVVVLDPASMSGASREENPAYQFQGFGPPREIARILLYRTELSRRLAAFNVVSQMQAQPGGVVVMTLEQATPGRQDAALVYKFGSPGGRLLEASFASQSIATYRAMVSARQIDPGAYDRDAASLQAVRWLTPWAPPLSPAPAGGVK